MIIRRCMPRAMRSPRSSVSERNRYGGGRLQAQIDSGQRHGPTSDEIAEIKALKGKVRDLEEANESLKQASIFFARELDPRHR